MLESNREALTASRRFIERTGRTEARLDAHAADFLIYALLQQRRHAEARGLIDEFRGFREEFETPFLAQSLERRPGATPGGLRA